MEQTNAAFQNWLKDMNSRARKCRQEDGDPYIRASFYAGQKVRGHWKISTGHSWWDKPVLVEEIHEYGDGIVCAHYYLEGVKMFSAKTIQNSGLELIRPTDLPDLFPLDKVVYFDHTIKTTSSERNRYAITVYGSNGVEL